jgi:hypothetical protein
MILYPFAVIAVSFLVYLHLRVRAHNVATRARLDMYRTECLEDTKAEDD